MEWTRRTLFPLALLAALPAAASCVEDGSGSPDDPIRQRTAAQAAVLAGLYAQAAAVRPADPRAAAFREHHLSHRALLLSGAANPATADPAIPAGYRSVAAPAPAVSVTSAGANPGTNTAVDTAGDSASSPDADAPAPSPSGANQPTAAALVSAERAAAAAADPDLATASGPLAGLLVDIAACRAVHCAALEPASAQAAQFATDAPELSAPTPGDLSAAQAILSAEHAAVYAYGALTPHLSGTQRTRAHGWYELHRQLRDGLESGIAARGATPVAMAAAYAFPEQPSDPAAAQTLAAYVETRVAAVCADAAAVASAAGRPYAAWAVLNASLRAYSWGRAPAAFPATFSA